MKQQIKLLKVIDFKPNEVISVELPRVYTSSKYQLRVKLKLTGSGGSVVENAPATIIKRVELVAISDKTTTIKSLSGVDILKISAYEQRGEQENVIDLDNNVAFGSYDLNFSCPDVIENAFITTNEAGEPLETPQLYSPKLFTLFNPTLYNPVNLVITWGNINDIVVGGVNRGIESAEVKLYTTDLPEISGVFAINRQLYKEAVVVGKDSDFRIELPKGNMIRKIYVMGIKNGKFDNSLINNIKVVVNENIVEYDIGFNALRNENAKFYQIPFDRLEDGVAVIDFDYQRDLKGLLDVRNVDSVRLSLDVNEPVGDTRIRVITQEITQ